MKFEIFFLCDFPNYDNNLIISDDAVPQLQNYPLWRSKGLAPFTAKFSDKKIVICHIWKKVQANECYHLFPKSNTLVRQFKKKRKVFEHVGEIAWANWVEGTMNLGFHNLLILYNMSCCYSSNPY